MSQRVSDFEYYHEIKDKMDQSENWEVHEVPKIESSKSHYNPTKKTVINKHIFDKGKSSNNREPKVRTRNMYKPRLSLVEDEEEQVRIRRRFKKTDNNNMATFTNLETFHRKIKQVKESCDILNNSSIKSLES